jgi:4-alpha-glucanotransferase
MRLEITLEYFTVPGENLYLMLRDGDEIPMEYTSAGRWTASFEVPDGTDVLEYSFELRRGGKTVRREWRGRKVAFPATPAGKRGSDDEAAINEYLVRDRWQDRPEDSPFWTDAFWNVIFKSRTAYAYQSERGNVSLVVPDAQVRGDEVLALAGSGSLFEEDWGWFIPFSNEGDGLWRVDLDVEEPFDYKVVVLDSTSGKPKIWENGDNHRFTDVPAEGEFIEVRDVVPFFETRRWKGAGTAVPVFSLRSEDSFGVGEFNDLKKLADWAAATGQRVIQLLPINDTTMTCTWTDSYPYNANSTFALHPQFIHLPAAGVKMDRKYKAMCKELNDLPAIDYERVNGEKIRLMREAFAEVGKGVMSGAAYRSFFAANKSWLIPYAVFRVLTDINGTPEFGKWKTLSEYSETKVVNFRRNHRVEVDFYCYVQFCLDAQLKEAVEYAHSKGIIIKGDLPIGISRTSVDAWQFPHLFNLDSQAGAPPDAFSVDGQNWGFPTYNWDEMAKDGYVWWKARLGKMSEYFDAFRIDHILGFFRIWEIPLGIKSGLQGHFNPALPYSENEIKEKGFDPHSQLFVPDPHRKGWFHPRISAQDTEDFNTLDDSLKNTYNDLYYDFFYRRHNAFWKECAMRKLPELLDSTGMLACGEDLGMIPACVPEVMKDLRILSLEIQRMPKSPDRVFDDPASYPYLSVCATGTHDTSTLRGWWQEDRPMTGRFYHEVLHCEGQAPHDCDPWVCEMIVKQHLDSPSMLCVLPLQDWMSIDGEVRYQGKPEDERINIPANSHHYWRWRMHITLEDLLSRSDFNRNLRNLVSDSGRA